MRHSCVQRLSDLRSHFRQLWGILNGLSLQSIFFQLHSDLGNVLVAFALLEDAVMKRGPGVSVAVGFDCSLQTPYLEPNYLQQINVEVCYEWLSRDDLEEYLCGGCSCLDKSWAKANRDIKENWETKGNRGKAANNPALYYHQLKKSTLQQSPL